MKKLTVFVFTPSYPNSRNAVANIFVKEQVKALVKLGHKVIVLTILKEPTKNFFRIIDNKIHQIVDDEIIVYKCQKTLYEAKLHFINQILINRSFKSLFFYAMKHYGKPDVIYAHFMSAAYSACCLDSNIPIVVLEHSGNLMNRCISFFEKKCLKDVLSKSFCYIATSEKLKDSIIRITNTSKNIRVVPNMVDDIFTFHPYNHSSVFSFFSLCRFDYDKRLDLLIDAFCIAFDKTDNVVLVVGGSGKEFENIKKMIGEKDRNNQIKLLGRLSREEALFQYRNCACFVLASRHETFGIVWREALCVGRPVITTNHGGFSDYDFKTPFGRMINVDNLNELVNALKYIRKNYQNYNLQEISRQNVEMYSSKKIAKKIERILMEATRNEV